MKTVLTIAGSDSIGGAGIQADLKTMMANGVYGMSVITALTAQNTLGVQAVLETPSDFLRQQIDSVCSDIRPDAVKIGLVPSAASLNQIVEGIESYELTKVVYDPVMVSSSHTVLMQEETIALMKKKMLSCVQLLTPNLMETEVLTGRAIQTTLQMQEAARELYERYGCAVLCKGGHLHSAPDDYLYDGQSHWFHGERIHNPNQHGTGCTLSSAIASQLAKGQSLPQAVEKAKQYMNQTLSAMLDLGHGTGPLDHGEGFLWEKR